MSPRNKNNSGFHRIQKPIAGVLLVSMALGQPVRAQVPAAPAAVPAAPPITPGVLRPRPPAAAPGAATNAIFAASSVTNVSPLLSSDLPPGKADQLVQVNYVDAPLDQLLAVVSEWTGRMLIKAPGVNAQITLKSNERIPVSQALEAIETVLAMNNVSLVKMGEKFLKIVPIAQNRTEGGAISFEHPDKAYPEADQLVSQMVQLKNIDAAEATPVLQPLLHGYGKMQPFERTNSILITETGANLNRIMEVLAYIDQPVESKVETRIYEIHYAKASDLASRINELIADTQGKEEKPRVDQAIAVPAIPTPPGVIRAPRPTSTTSAVDTSDASERGAVRGKVKIVSDERLNILFIISRTDNFTFFDKIITVLDRATDPEITVKVVPLEFAKAKDISSILNEFIGAAKEDSTRSGTQNPTPPGGTGTAANDARSVALRDYMNSRPTTANNAAAAAARARLAPVSDADKDVIGRLSPTTRILADERSNSLLMMGRRSDLASLNQLIEKLDVMLAQVLIEAVIIEVNLGGDLSYGIDWLQRSMTAYESTKTGPNGGVNVNAPVFSFGGGTAFNGAGFQDGALVDRSTPLGGGLTYYSTLYGLNLDVVLKMTKSSRDARILSTPVILTTDNKEASIKVGESRPIVNANIVQNTGQNTQNYEYRDIGIELKVTPHINPSGVVEMEIKQTADNVGGNVNIGGSEVPIITRREMSADVSVKNHQTILLGGLTGTDKSKSRAGIPILMDIPLIGALFRSDSMSDSRTELLVLLTPYVLKTTEEAREETARMHGTSASSKTRWHEGWSDSELPRMTDKELQELLKRRSARLIKADEDSSGGPIVTRVGGGTETEKPRENVPVQTLPEVITIDTTATNTPAATPPPATVQPVTALPVAAPPVEAVPQQPAAPPPAPAAAPVNPAAAPAPR